MAQRSAMVLPCKRLEKVDQADSPRGVIKPQPAMTMCGGGWGA